VIEFKESSNSQSINHKASAVRTEEVCSLQMTEVNNFSSQGLRLTVHGQSRYSVPRGNTTYIGREELIKDVVFLFGSQSGEPMFIDSGARLLNFAFVLPKALPSSFEAYLASIRYTIEAAFIKPWSLFDLKAEVKLPVVTFNDLNGEPALKIESRKQEVKTFCCASGSITMNVSIPFTGYSCGQTINVNVAVENNSRVNVKGIKIELVQRVSYMRKQKKISSDLKVLDTTKLAGIPTGTDSQLKGTVTVPHDVGQAKMSYLFIVSHEVWVTAELSYAHFDPRIKIPIEIGTVPLKFSR